MRQLLKAAAFAALLSTPAFAASTINPNVPAPNSPMSSAPIRANFQAAYNDITNLQGAFAGTSAPNNPVRFQQWADTSTTPATLKVFDGAVWVTQAQLSSTAHTWLPMGTWSGVAVAPQYGGTGQDFSAATGVLYYTAGVASVGTAPPSSIPTPTPSTLGGVFSKAAVSNQFLTQVGTDGVIAAAQPACGNLSDAAATCNSTDAANLTGTVASARLSGSYTGITGVGTLTAGQTGTGFNINFGASTTSGTVPASNGGAGSTNGILKANGAGTVSAAVSGTDYAPATSGSAILKGNGSGGFSSAVSGTDYAPATSGSSILLGNGSGGFSAYAGNSPSACSNQFLRNQTQSAAGALTNTCASVVSADISGQVGLSKGGTNADLSATGGTSQVLKQVSAGAAVTVGQLAASDLSNGTSGSGAVALVGAPTFTGAATFARLINNGTNPSSLTPNLYLNYNGAGNTLGIVYKDDYGSAGTYDAVQFWRNVGATPTQVGSINTTTSSTAFVTSSDRRLKENIEDATADSGAVIDALRVRKYDWKGVENSHEDFGFIAQEEYQVFPKAISKGDDDPNTISRTWGREDSKLVPVIIKELQSLRSRVTALETPAP